MLLRRWRLAAAYRGGRIAGASLAIRLGRQHIPVLLIERATFPSWPSVPSSPMVHPGTMRLLDELGLSEAEYTHPIYARRPGHAADAPAHVDRSLPVLPPPILGEYKIAYMIEQGGGTIVNTSSVLGITAAGHAPACIVCWSMAD